MIRRMATLSIQSKIKLPDGHEIPHLGFGVSFMIKLWEWPPANSPS